MALPRATTLSRRGTVVRQQLWLGAADDELAENVRRMHQAAQRLLGEHDFRGFAQSAEARENTVRTIYRCEVAEEGREVLVTVQGNGFLYNMVRNIVGTLIEIGRGHWNDDRIDLVLSSLDRGNAGPTAPPEGLTLVCVHY